MTTMLASLPPFSSSDSSSDLLDPLAASPQALTGTLPDATTQARWRQVLQVLEIESQALTRMIKSLNPEPVLKALDLILTTPGRLVISGMGKSGHVGKKLAATFASTGTPALFLHPAEGVHGDLGMVTPQDVVVLLSNSGETIEVLNLLPTLRLLKTPIIAITNKGDNTLSRAADVAITLNVTEEACPLNLAPSATTTATLALGDALALTAMQQRAFTEEAFAVFHPAGNLGKRLLCRVGDVMAKRPHDTLPVVNPDDSFLTALLEMTRHQLGHVLVMAEDGATLKGILSDGDVRRALTRQATTDPQATQELTVQQIMTYNPKTIPTSMPAIEALKLMHEKKITALPVTETDAGGPVIGVLHLHDLLDEGFRL